jgi:hypothetical protein
MSVTLVIDQREVPTADELFAVRMQVSKGNDALERLSMRLERVANLLREDEKLDRQVTWEDVGRLFAVLDVAETDIGLMQKYVANVRDHMVELWLDVEMGGDDA